MPINAWTDTGGPTWIYNTEYDPVHGILYAGIFADGVDKGGVWKYDGTWSDTTLGSALDGYIVWALAYDAVNDLLYAGTEDHGVWAYDGATWTDTGGAVTTYGVWVLTYDAVRNILYAGTGEFNPDTGYYYGVWKYDGATWTIVSDIINGANLLSAQDSSLEAAGVGGWVAFNGSIANSTDWAAVGTHSLKLTVTDPNSAFWAFLDVTADTSAAGEYTISCQFKGIPGAWYAIIAYDDVTGQQNGPNFQADGTTQRATFTGTFGAASTYRQIGIWSATYHNPGEDVYADNFRLVAGIDVATFSISYLAYDPNNNILYAGTEPWYVDLAGIWSCVNPDTAPEWTQFANADVDRGHAWTLVFDPVQGVLYAGAYQNVGQNATIGILRYNGDTWTNIGMTDYSVWYLTYSTTYRALCVGTIDSGVWIYQGGVWTDITDNLPTGDRNALDPGSLVAFNAAGPGLFAGTWEDGVWWREPFTIGKTIHREEKKSAYVSILDPTGSTALARLTEHFPTTEWTPDIFENMSFESVNRGGYTVASFTIHRPVTQFWADLQYRNQVIIGRGSEIYWEGYISKPIRSIKPDVIEVACLGWSAELNQLWTAADITAPVGGYKMSTFINSVLLVDPRTSIVAGMIETGDYAYPEGTVFAFAPNKFYFDALEELDAGNNFNWGVWGNRAIDLRAKHSSVDWLVWTGDCEDLTISPNPEALCNYVMVNFTQDGTHYEQVTVQDAISQALYGIIMQKVDIPGKIDESSGGAGIPGGATHIAEVYLAEHKDLKVAAEFTCNRIFDAYGAEQYLGKVRGGEVVRIVDWLPTEETLGGVSNIATFEIKSPKYDHDNDTLAITPTEFLPSTDIQIARLQATGY